MKRLAAALAALMMLCLCACGPAKPAPDSQDETPPPQAEEPAPPPEPTEEELAAQEIDDLLASLTTEEKVGQLFFVRCPADSAAEDVAAYHLGGYLLFGRDYQDTGGAWLTKEQFTDTVQSYQDAAMADTGIPLLIGVDEEKVQTVIDIIREHSHSRKQMIPTTTEMSYGYYPSMPVEVVVGGATIFVVDIERFERV